MISSLLITLVIVAWAFADEEAAQQARQVVNKRMPAQYPPPPPPDPIWNMRPVQNIYPRTRDGRIVDTLGKEVILRGVNIDNKVSTIGSQYLPKWTQYSSTFGHTYGVEYVRKIVELGFNAVRLSVHWESIEPTTPGTYDYGYMDKIKQMVSDCIDYNLYVVIDWHHDAWDKTDGSGYAGWPSWAKTTSVAGQSVGSCPATAAGQPSVSKTGCNTACHCNNALESTQYNLNYIADWTLFWDNTPAPGDNTGLQTRWLNTYGALASRIGHAHRIIYADWNEPGMSWDLYNCLDGRDNGVYDKSYYRKNYDDGDLQACASSFYTKYGNYMSALRSKISSFASGTDNPVMMINSPLFEKVKDIPSAHFSGGIWPNNAIFGKSFYTPNDEDGKAKYLTSSQSISKIPSDTPTLIAEYGANVFTSNRKKVLDAMDNYFLGGFYYAFKEKTGYHNDWRLLVSETSVSIQSNVANDIVRPYPQYVAGKVTRSFFEHTRSDKRYTVEYSTVKIGTSSYHWYGSDSYISVPAHIYPNGYTITTLTGATVQSSANAPLLRLRGAASTVKVVLIKA